MPLQKLQFKPGINKETTSYSNEGGWEYCDKVRFRFGYPEKIGGWVKRNAKSFLGSARSLHSFNALDGSNFLAYGTDQKYYLDLGGGIHDITPIRATAGGVGTSTITFSATSGSSEITVSHTAHGATTGDFVTFSDATSLGGQINANVLNQEYKIDNVVNADSYTIIAREVDDVQNITVAGVYTPDAREANASDTSKGGTDVTAEYQIRVGLDVAVSGTGWGAGTWGRSTWGSTAAIATDTEAILRLYTEDNFGEDLIFNVRDGNIYYWDKSTAVPADPADPYNRAVTLASLSSDVETPTIAKQVMVSDRDRHVIAFGCDAQGSIGTQDPLLIRFSDQENPLEWTATSTNTAGDLRIGTGSEIVTAAETRQQILVWTDKSLHAMQYLGDPFIFGINMLSENITIAGPNAVIAVDDSVFWMGLNEFYTYNGAVQRIPCTVRDYVFSDFNEEQYEKVFAGLNSSFGEVWWFYCSANSTNNDRYVVYNYQQNIWYYGTLSRTAWLDRGLTTTPMAAFAGHLYAHEVGFDDGSTSPASPIYSFITSSQMALGDADKFVSINRMLPDLTFRDSTASSPEATLVVSTKNYFNTRRSDLQQVDTGDVAGTTFLITDITPYQIDMRVRGRTFTFGISSNQIGNTWRLGSPSIGLRLDGRR